MVAQAVVDRLEVVQIQQKEARLLPLFHPLEPRRHRLLAGRAVEQAGEGVLPGQYLQRLLLLVLGVHILQGDENGAVIVPVLVVQRCNSDLIPPVTAWAAGRRHTGVTVLFARFLRRGEAARSGAELFRAVPSVACPPGADLPPAVFLRHRPATEPEDLLDRFPSRQNLAGDGTAPGIVVRVDQPFPVQILHIAFLRQDLATGLVVADDPAPFLSPPVL